MAQQLSTTRNNQIVNHTSPGPANANSVESAAPEYAKTLRNRSFEPEKSPTAPSTGETRNARMAAKLTVYPNSDSPSKVRPRIVKPASGMISPVNSAGIKTARVVVVYAELAQSY